MDDVLNKIIKLINKHNTCNEICEKLAISNKQLNMYIMQLVLSGIYYRLEYRYDGKTIYKLTDKKDDLYNNSNIILEVLNNEISFLVISDIHVGSKCYRQDLLDRAFNYCVKNNINLILNCGDLIDGVGYNIIRESTMIIKSQIETLVNNYPYDPNIVTFAIGGNHDLDATKAGYDDIFDIIYALRKDIIISDFANKTIELKNDKIHMYHPIKGYPYIDNNATITLKGHSHAYSVCVPANNKINITLSSLSDLSRTIPSAIELTVNFNHEKISLVNIKQIYFKDKDYVVGEINSIINQKNKTKKITK